MTNAAENHMGSDLTFDGTRFRIVESRGQSQGTLVFLHGVGMRLEFWAPQLSFFSKNYRCIAYDMLGHGESELPPESPSLADYSAQFSKLMEHLSPGDVTLIGHSMGALITLDVALRYPERIERIIAMNGVYERTEEQKAAIAQRVASLSEDMPDWSPTLERWLGDDMSPSRDEKKSNLLNMLNQIQPNGYALTYRLFSTSDRAHSGKIQSITVPSLFLTGSHDPNSTPAMSEAMARECSSGTVKILDNERHMMSFVNPEATNLAIQNFLLQTSSSHPVSRRSCLQ